MPRTPSQADPRSVVAQSRLEEEPRLKTRWAGYAFARDFREDCGHAFMLDDQTYSERQQAVQQPGTCLYRHTSDRPCFFTPPARPAPRPAPRRARWTVATRFRACCCSFAFPWSIGNTKTPFTRAHPPEPPSTPSATTPRHTLLRAAPGGGAARPFILPICRSVEGNGGPH
jgi:Cytochrome c552